MRILFIDHGQYITVAVPKLIEMAEMLAEHGHSVEIALTHKTRRFRMEQFVRNGVQYRLFPSLMFGRFRHGACLWDALRRIAFYRKRSEYDVIHARGSRPTVILPSLYMKKRFGIPMVQEWADYFSGGGTISERSSPLYGKTLGRVESFFETAFRLRADGATVVTSFFRDRLIEMGFPTERILVSRNGGLMDGSQIRSGKDARSRMGWKDDAVYAVYFGRIFPRDLAFLVDSMDAAVKSCPELKVVIVGDTVIPERYSRPYILQEEWTIDDRFVDIGSAADFFLIPMTLSIANRARWPSKIGSYLSFAKPVLSTPVSDFPQIFDEVDIGILCDDTVESFSSGLCRMVESKERWGEWGRNSLNYGRLNLDWSVIMRNLVAFYEEVLQNAGE